jgi:peptide/nickel transport system substrate-binding protein
VALVVFATSCAAPPATAPAAGQPGAAPARETGPKKITAAIRGDPRTLSDPVNFAAGGSSSAGVTELEQLVHAGLLLADLQGGLRPLLAEAAPTLDNGLWKLHADGRMETAWKLKDSVFWHDGTPVTTADVLFAATIAQDKALPISQDAAFAYVEGVEAVDRQTVNVIWKKPFFDADKLFSQARGSRILPMPRHLLETAYKEDRTTFVQHPYFGAEYLGAGPYRLREWALGSHLVLVANDRFVLGRPKIDQIEVKFILDTNTMVANLLAGALDLTLGRGLTPEQAILVRDQWREGKVDAGLENTTSLYPQFTDPQPALLTDVRFRRALFHALDRQQVVDTFLAGFVPVAHSIITPEDPVYRDIERRVVRYNYDPRRSIEILDGMGLTRGPDGMYRDASGQRISVELRTRAHALREKLQPVIVDEWSKIGIVADPVVVPEQRIADRAYQAAFPGFYFRFGNSSQVTEHVSTDVALPENNFVGRNPIRYRNPEHDALIGRFETTVSKAQHVDLLGEIINRMTDQLLLMTLFHEPQPVLISDRLVNVGGGRGDAVQCWNAHEWDVRS